MKAIEHCVDCLSGLAQKTLQLSYCNNRNTYSRCCTIIEKQFKDGKSPPGIANELLKYIKDITGFYDPFDFLKENELGKAKKAFEQMADIFSDSLEGAIKLSALGNSLDFFTDDSSGFDIEGFNFLGGVDKIENEIYIKSKDVLILGDNIGDFIFDMPLVHFLENMGKHVYYAVKEHPIQNDLSMPDVLKYDFWMQFDNIISTCTDEVGIRLEDMKGKVKDLWNTDAIIIAKGMGNYETISEYHTERPVIHIMKVKCPAVSQSVGYKEGAYIAKLF
jgi:damage-control phosphatase, subfamily I